MALYSTCSLAICLLILNFGTVSSLNEAHFDRLELLNSTYVEGLYNVSEFRVTKTNRTTYVANVVWDALTDFGNDMEIEVKIYYNRYNNNQYNLSPLRVPRSSLCAVMKRFYPMVFSPSTRNTTNFVRPDGTACPYNKVRQYWLQAIDITIWLFFVDSFQGHYYFWHYVFDGSRMPPLVMVGHYKAEFFFHYKKITVWHVLALGKVMSPTDGFGLLN